MSCPCVSPAVFGHVHPACPHCAVPRDGYSQAVPLGHRAPPVGIWWEHRAQMGVTALGHAWTPGGGSQAASGQRGAVQGHQGGGRG